MGTHRVALAATGIVALLALFSEQPTWASQRLQARQQLEPVRTTKPPAAVGAQATPTGSPNGYVGSETCGQCHADQRAFYLATAHRKTLEASFPPDRSGCEACHGGGRAHTELHLAAARLYKDGKAAEARALYADTSRSQAARMRNFSAMSPADSSAVCLKCHEGAQGKNEERFNFRRSEHARHGVGCLDCHSSHAPKAAEFLVRNTQPNLCFTCHTDQKAAFAKPFHHKVPEGGMKCSDCHNQHGGFQAKQLRTGLGGDTACFRCHTDKAGPFVYEHAPIRTEGCQGCHLPHGSNNPRLLTRSEVRFLCLECHSNTPGIPVEGSGLGPTTPSFHDINNARYQNCTVCHAKIHGSNAHRTYFR